MARHLRRFPRPSVATSCLVLMIVLIVVGGLIFWKPFLTARQRPVAEIPAPSALFTLAEFPVAPNQQACMDSVTVTHDSRLVQFALRPARSTRGGGPPVALTLSAPGYRYTVLVPGGYLGGSATFPITPPPHDLIATACFVNLGVTKLLLDGTNEARTVSRPSLEIAGRKQLGDIALFFRTGGSQSVLDRLGVVFGHASNLTDGLIPVWLVWLIALLVAFGTPVALMLAFYSALLEDAAKAP